MEKCIMLWNGFSIKRNVRSELINELGCEEDNLEEYLDENNITKVQLVYDEITSKIGFSPRKNINNPGVYSILGEEYIAAITATFELNEKNYEINIIQKSYKNEKDTETIEVTITSENGLNEFDEDFYNIKIKVKNSIKKFYNEIYFIEDTQNEKLCSELYLMIYNNENNFRSIINRCMVINYGVKWFENVIDKKYFDSANNCNKWYREQRNAEFKDVRCELHNLLIDQLITMLKDSQIGGITSEERSKFKEFVNGLKATQLKTKLENIKIDKESIWDKDFRKYISDEFANKWDEYKDMRNMVAHNKLICKEIADKIRERSIIIAQELENISNKISRANVAEEKKTAEEIWKEIEEDAYINDANGEPIPDIEDVIDEIDENEKYYMVIDEINNKLLLLSSTREEVSYSIDEIISYYNEYDGGIEKKALNCILSILERVNIEEDNFKRLCIQEITSQSILQRFMDEALEGLGCLLDKINTNDYNVVSRFCIGRLVDYTNIYGQKITINANGDITPERGGNDSILVEMKVSNERVAKGYIEKQYFDYSVSDYGAGMPEIEAYLDISIDDIEGKILSDIDTEIDMLKRINNDLTNTFSMVFE